MTAIGGTLDLYPKDQIALIHDRCEYDAALSEAFNHMKNDETFKYRDRFTKIDSMSWEECIHLQPADFLLMRISGKPREERRSDLGARLWNSCLTWILSVAGR